VTKKEKIHIIDQGLGMTADEVENTSSCFLELKNFRYKDSAKDSGIIGHFGLGFYSAFMVAEKVEIITKSFKDEPCCTGLDEVQNSH
jgi:molecular chaperone HtpG